jgi:hypothetical protein
MTPTESFTKFVSNFLLPTKASRYAELSNSKKGQKKILNYLCHEFESVVRKECIKSPSYDSMLELPCFVFENSRGFGALRDSVREALEELAVADSWLIVLIDGSAGAYRPEGKYDDEILIAS